MSMPRYAGKRDANESDLVTIASQLGVQFEQIGPLDFWCGWRGRWVPLEIKNDSKITHRVSKPYTDKQVLFLARCKERQLPVWIWRTENDVYRDLGAVRTA